MVVPANDDRKNNENNNSEINNSENDRKIRINMKSIITVRIIIMTKKQKSRNDDNNNINDSKITIKCYNLS